MGSVLACVAVVVLSGSASAAVPTETVPRAPAEPGGGSAERADRGQGRGSNTLGAIAGFSLLGGWLLIGGLQLRRGRRRLAEATASRADSAKPRTLDPAGEPQPVTTSPQPPPPAPSATASPP